MNKNKFIKIINWKSNLLPSRNYGGSFQQHCFSTFIDQRNWGAGDGQGTRVRTNKQENTQTILHPSDLCIFGRKTWLCCEHLNAHADHVRIQIWYMYIFKSHCFVDNTLMICYWSSHVDLCYSREKRNPSGPNIPSVLHFLYSLHPSPQPRGNVAKMWYTWAGVASIAHTGVHYDTAYVNISYLTRA